MRSDRPCLHSALYCTVLHSTSPFKVPSTWRRVFELYALLLRMTHESLRDADVPRESGFDHTRRWERPRFPALRAPDTGSSVVVSQHRSASSPVLSPTRDPRPIGTPTRACPARS